MKRSLAVLTIGLFATSATAAVIAESRADNELNEATASMHGLTGPQAQAGIPDSVLRRARCVAVIPKMLKAGFVVGGQHGASAAILTYSRSKGAYAGATLQGAELNQDHGETRELYGSEVAFPAILNGQAGIPHDAAVRDFVRTINVDVSRAGR